MSLNIKQNFSIKNYSTFKIGGLAKFFVEVYCERDLKKAIFFAKKENLKILFIGKGSNCLFSDNGFNGMVILNKIKFSKINEFCIEVGSGYSLPALSNKICRNNCGGLEFAKGIPGSVGGAVYMNAGAFGYSMSDVFFSAKFLTFSGKIIEFYKKDIKFGYRYSSFQKKMGFIVSCKFKFFENKNAIKKQTEFFEKKKKTQDYKNRSIGSIFKNLNDVSAGLLIEKCGLKGINIGDAKVSKKHANFIINKRNATSDNVLNLIKLIKKTVKEKTGKTLKTEIKLYGF